MIISTAALHALIIYGCVQGSKWVDKKIQEHKNNKGKK